MINRFVWKLAILGVSALFLGYVAINDCHAAQKKGSSGKQSKQASGQKKSFDAHDTGVRFYFQDTDMDFHFGTIVLGSTVNHGAEIGEAFYAASQIKDGDAASWQSEETVK